jgi:hypothetical protein
MALPRFLVLISFLFVIGLSTVTAAGWNMNPMAQVPESVRSQSPISSKTLSVPGSTDDHIELIVNKFMARLDNHIKKHLRKVLHNHVRSMPPKVRGATSPAQQKEMEAKMADKLGDFLAQDFKPHVYKAFITLERESRNAKISDKQMKKLARQTFNKLERQWKDYAKEKIGQWERDKSYLLSDANANSYKISTEKVTSLSKRTLYKRSIWNNMLKFIITFEFIEVLFTIFSVLAALIGLGVNRYRKNHHRHQGPNYGPVYGPTYGYPY